MDRFEMERLAMQLWLCDFAVALKFPGENVGKIFVVAKRFAFRGLMLFSKMCAARFVARKRIGAHQLGEFEEIGDATGAFE